MTGWRAFVEFYLLKILCALLGQSPFIRPFVPSPPCRQALLMGQSPNCSGRALRRLEGALEEVGAGRVESICLGDASQSSAHNSTPICKPMLASDLEPRIARA
jgi:hypothetical protein